MRILVADDDPLVRTVLAAFLGTQGHDVTLAPDGQAAWTMFQAEPFPAVVSDWMMPGLDGLELCRRIRAAETSQYTYVLLLTALGGKSRYLEGMDAGADDFLTKPVESDDLRVRLRVAQRILGLEAHVTRLERLLPICAWCKKIRDRGEGWVDMEAYVARQAGGSVTHGICPTCSERTLGALRRGQAASR